MKLTIWHKGMILIGTLVALEGAFVSALFYQVQRCEQDASSQTEQRRVLFCAQHLANDLYKTHEALTSWIALANDETELGVRRHLTRVQLDIKSLLEYTPRNSQAYTKLQEIKEQIDSAGSLILAWLDTVRNVPQDERTPWLQQAQSEIRDPKRRTLDTSVDFLEEQIESFARSPLPHTELAGVMKLITWVGMATNLALAIALGFAFTRNITNRLSILDENSKRLAKHENLLGVVSGNDEIVQLDMAFHKMADEMAILENMRRTYVSVFRDELGKPISEVESRLAFLVTNEGLLPTEKAARMLDVAQRNLSRLGTIIDDLTATDTASQGIRLHPSDCKSRELVERAIESVRSLLDAHGDVIETRIDECSFFADGQRLQQVLINFLSNAIKYSPYGTKIEAGVLMLDDAVEFYVKDNGRGIPPEKIGALFERFEQVETSDGARGSGTGLGLSVCKEIVELHKGSTGVQSEVGKGSRFWFRLPRVAGRPAGGEP